MSVDNYLQVGLTRSEPVDLLTFFMSKYKFYGSDAQTLQFRQNRMRLHAGCSGCSGRTHGIYWASYRTNYLDQTFKTDSQQMWVPFHSIFIKTFT